MDLFWSPQWVHPLYLSPQSSGGLGGATAEGIHARLGAHGRLPAAPPDRIPPKVPARSEHKRPAHA